MSDDVITLDSSDDEPSPAASQEPIADQLRRRCKQLNIKPVSSQITNNKSRGTGIPSNVAINKVSVIRGPTGIIPINPTLIGNTQIKKTPVPKIIPHKYVRIASNPAPPTVPTKISNVVIRPVNKNNTFIKAQQSFTQMPIIVNSSSLAKTNTQRIKTSVGVSKAVNASSALKIRNITNNQPNVNQISANITITHNGKVVPREQLISGSKREGGNASMPLRKKRKIVLDSPDKRAVDSIVRKVAKQQSINLDAGRSKVNNEIIPTVEIDDDDDEIVSPVPNNTEIPIEYEPDNSKENEELVCIDVPVTDPLQLDPIEQIVNDDPIESAPVDVADVVIEDTEPLLVPLTEMQSNDSCYVEVISSGIQSLRDSVGDISSSSIIGVISKRTSDADDSDCVENVEETCPSNHDVSVLSKCDFYTPKKQKELSDNDVQLLSDISINVSHALNGLRQDEGDRAVVAVPVVVKVSLTPEDKKRVENFEKNATKKRIAPFQLDQPKKKTKADDSSEIRTINETYQRFIDLCFKLDSSEDMKKIVDKKIIAYYMSVHESFTESKSFMKFMEGKIKNITESPGSLFLFIKDVVEELKVRRVKKKDGPIAFNEREKSPLRLNKSKSDESDKEESSSDDEGVDEVLKSKIRKLERAMRKLNKAIKKLQEREVDCDDDNSAYILEDRYKSRLIRIYQKLCQLTGEREEACSRRSRALKGLSRLTLCGGRFPKLVSAVKTAANSRPHWFPDYVDVLKCVEHCAKEQGLNLRADELHREAREAFVEIGTLLQQKRREAEYEDFSCMLGSSVDPAEEDTKLAEALEKNKEISKNREMEILNKFVEKQYNLKLVPEDVPDVDADKSEGSEDESGDEDATSTAGDDKSKRADNTDKTEVIAKAEIHVENIKSNDKSNLVKGDTVTDVNKINSVKDSNEISVKSVEIHSDINAETPLDADDNAISVHVDEISSDPAVETRLNEMDADDNAVSVQVHDVEVVESEKEKINVEEFSKARTTNSVKEVDEDDSKSNSSLSLVDLITSDSRDSFNSGVEADTEDSKSDRRFKKLKTVRPSSAMSGVDLLNDDSVSMDHKKDNVMDVDESVDEVNTTVIENLGLIPVVVESLYENMPVNEVIKAVIDDTTSASASSSEVLTVEEDKESDIPATVSEDTDVTITETTETTRTKKICVSDEDVDQTVVTTEVIVEETNSESNQDITMEINVFESVDDGDRNNDIVDDDDRNCEIVDRNGDIVEDDDRNGEIVDDDRNDEVVDDVDRNCEVLDDGDDGSSLRLFYA